MQDASDQGAQVPCSHWFTSWRVNLNHSASDAAAASAVGAIIIAYVVFIVAAMAFSIWIHWRILAKAGYNGALSLLILTGIGGIVPVLILAFGKWPLENEVEALRAGVGGAAPGTAVTPTS